MDPDRAHLPRLSLQHAIVEPNLFAIPRFFTHSSLIFSSSIESSVSKPKNENNLNGIQRTDRYLREDLLELMRRTHHPTREESSLERSLVFCGFCR